MSSSSMCSVCNVCIAAAASSSSIRENASRSSLADPAYNLMAHRPDLRPNQAESFVVLVAGGA